MTRKPSYEELEKRVQALEKFRFEQSVVQEEFYQDVILNRTLFETAPVFFVAINAEGKTITANQTMLQALGYKQEEMIGKDYMATCVPPKNRRELSEIFETLIRKHEPTVNENYVVAKNGDEMLMEWHGRSIFNKDGKFLYFIGMGINITERRKAEKELQREKEKLAMILESTPHGIALVDDEDNYIYLNPFYTKITGYTLEDIPSKSVWFEKAYPDKIYRKLVTQTWNTDISCEGLGELREFKVTCKNGDVKHIEFRTSFFNNQKIMVLTDVTLKKASEEMIRDRNRLQGALELSGAICHEMTQPLMSALGYFDLMLMDMTEDNPNYSIIGKIRPQLERMSDITKQLMAISRYKTKDYLDGKILDLGGASME